MRTRSRGFTLIELMIAVAVVGILAAIAYPSYTAHIRKGRRAAAEAALMDLASREQTYLLDRRAYAGTLADLGVSLPNEIVGYYQIDFPGFVATANPPTFTARATPIGGQAVAGEQTLNIDNTGAKTPANVSGYWGK